jgi:hypothetical protein
LRTLWPRAQSRLLDTADCNRNKLLTQFREPIGCQGSGRACFAPLLTEMESAGAIKCNGKGCTNPAQAMEASLGQASIGEKPNTVNAAANHAIRYRKVSG